MYELGATIFVGSVLMGGVVDELFSWNTSDRLGRDLQLHDGVYFCPSCDNFSLMFEVTALYS